MERPPENWEEVVNAPEIPWHLEDDFVQSFWYQRAPGDPPVRFVIIIYKVDMGHGTYAYFLSHETATSLHSAGFRENCDHPAVPVEVQYLKSIVYDYEATKRYADWYFEQQGRFQFRSDSYIDLHFALLFFVQDKNWKPFHQGYLVFPDSATVVKHIGYFTMEAMTREALGQENIYKNQDEWFEGEMEFIRVLLGLSVLRPDIATRELFNNFVKKHVRRFNQTMQYQISLSSIMRKIDYIYVWEFGLRHSPKLKTVIYHYFLTVNSLLGDYVRHALRKFQTISFFNIIFRFVTLEEKRLVHNDESILGQAALFMEKYRDLAPKLVDLLPYADLLVLNFDENYLKWKKLAAVAYLDFVQTHPEYFGEYYKSLVIPVKELVPELMPKMEVIENVAIHGIYKYFEELTCFDMCMKAIPWAPWDYETTTFLCHGLKNLFKLEPVL